MAIKRDTDDQKIITPALLAINRDIKSIPPYKFDKDLNIPQLRSCKDINRRKKYLDLLHTQLWRRWAEEYIYSETIISEDENLESILNPSEGDTSKSPPTNMKENIQKRTPPKNSVVGAENNGAMKYDPGTTELEGLKIRRKYHRGNLTKAISRFQNAIESGEETYTILWAHCAVKLRYESLREIEEKIQK